MPFDNLFKILRVLEQDSPELAEEIITDANKLANLVENDVDAISDLVLQSTVALTKYLDKKTLDGVNEVLSRSV